MAIAERHHSNSCAELKGCTDNDPPLRSYLGFGLMAARAATLDWEETAAANPCVPLDHTGSFDYGNKRHELRAAKQGCATQHGFCAYRRMTFRGFQLTGSGKKPLHTARLSCCMVWHGY